MAPTQVQTNVPTPAAREKSPQRARAGARASNSTSKCHGNSPNCKHDVSSFLPESILHDSQSKHEMGYMYTKDNNGGYVVKPRDGTDGSEIILNPEAEYLPYSTFFRYWKQEYPNVKVHKAMEDICEQCYIFMHRAHQMTKKSVGSPVTVSGSDSSRIGSTMM